MPSFAAVKLKKAETVKRDWDDRKIEAVELKSHAFETLPENEYPEGVTDVVKVTTEIKELEEIKPKKKLVLKKRKVSKRARTDTQAKLLIVVIVRE